MWTDRDRICEALLNLEGRDGTVIVTGGGRGADTIADDVARELGFERLIVPANWERYGRSAGPRRNTRMLDLHPVQVIAFRLFGSSPGTDHCVREARRRDIPTRVVDG
jgi:hypothetical protein